MRADELRAALLRLLPMAATLAQFTPTPKDDQAVAIVGRLFSDDQLFAQVKDLLELK